MDSGGRANVTRSVTITTAEANALNTFGAAVLAANSVEPWATQTEGQPYWFAHKALMAALRDLFGADAQEIREIMLDADSATAAIAHYFGELFTVDCMCSEVGCVLDHDTRTRHTR